MKFSVFWFEKFHKQISKIHHFVAKQTNAQSFQQILPILIKKSHQSSKKNFIPPSFFNHTLCMWMPCRIFSTYNISQSTQSACVQNGEKKIPWLQDGSIVLRHTFALSSTDDARMAPSSHVYIFEHFCNEHKTVFVSGVSALCEKRVYGFKRDSQNF